MQRIFVKPIGRVLDPATGEALPDAGAWVEKTQYWLRRVKDGDVLKSQPPQEVRQPARKSKEDK